jgi:hypothetical protein
MRTDLWIMAGLLIYGLALVYLSISGTFHDFVVFPFLLSPFVVDQLYLFRTRTRFRRVYALNAVYLSVAMAVLLYIAVR